MRLLITGAAGFIGSNFLRLRKQIYPNDTIVVLDSLTYAGNYSSIEDVKNFTFVHGDICDQKLVESILSDYKIESVVHFAAESHVDRSILEPDVFIKTNVVGTHNLLYCAKKHGVKRFVSISTDECFGDLDNAAPAFTEENHLHPNSPYSASKTSSDLISLSYFRTYKFPVIVTRCSNNYGPYQFPEKLIPLMTINALSDKNLPVYGTGLNIRDWIHVEDHCRAINLVLESGKEGETYNIGGRAERTNLEIIHNILEILNKPKSLITFVQDRLGHDRRYAINDSKIERELGFTRNWTLESGLVDTVNWYKNNEKWWRDIISGEYLNWYFKNYSSRGIE